MHRSVSGSLHIHYRFPFSVFRGLLSVRMSGVSDSFVFSWALFLLLVCLVQLLCDDFFCIVLLYFILLYFVVKMSEKCLQICVILTLSLYIFNMNVVC